MASIPHNTSPETYKSFPTLKSESSTSGRSLTDRFSSFLPFGRTSPPSPPSNDLNERLLRHSPELGTSSDSNSSTSSSKSSTSTSKSTPLSSSQESYSDSSGSIEMVPRGYSLYVEAVPTTHSITPITITAPAAEMTAPASLKERAGSCFSKAFGLVRKVATHPLTSVALVATSVATAVACGHYLDTVTHVAKYVAIGGVGLGSAGAAYFARHAISHFPTIEAWASWTLNSISHPAYHLLVIPTWTQLSSAYLATYIAACIFTGAAFYDLSSSALQKLINSKPTDEDLAKALAIFGLNTQDVDTSTKREAFLRFLQDHWKAIAITAFAIPATVVLSIPSIGELIAQNCSPFLANLINSVIGSTVNIAVGMPIGYLLAQAAYRSNVFYNMLAPGSNRFKATASKISNLICIRGKSILITTGLTLAIKGQSIFPQASLIAQSVIGTFALLIVGFGLGCNQAEIDLNGLLIQHKIDTLDLEIGETLIDPELSTCCKDPLNLQRKFKKWDANFGAAQFIRENSLTFVGSTAVIGLSFAPGINIPLFSGIILVRTIFAGMMLGCTLQGWASHSFTRNPPDINSKKSLHRIQAKIANLFTRFQSENLCLFTITQNSEGLGPWYNEAVLGMTIITGALVGIGGGAAQSFSNRNKRNIQAPAAFQSLAIRSALSLL